MQNTFTTQLRSIRSYFKAGSYNTYSNFSVDAYTDFSVRGYTRRVASQPLSLFDHTKPSQYPLFLAAECSCQSSGLFTREMWSQHTLEVWIAALIVCLAARADSRTDDARLGEFYTSIPLWRSGSGTNIFSVGLGTPPQEVNLTLSQAFSFVLTNYS